MTEIQRPVIVDISEQHDGQVSPDSRSLDDSSATSELRAKDRVNSLTGVRSLTRSSSQEHPKRRTASVDSAISLHSSGSDENKPHDHEDEGAGGTQTPPSQDDSKLNRSKTVPVRPVQPKSSEDTPTRPAPPQRPARPPPSSYEKFLKSSSPTMESRPPPRERRTVHFATASPVRIGGSPEHTHSQYPPDHHDNERESPSDANMDDCVGLDVMVKLQAPLAGEVLEESDNFEYPDWAKKRDRTVKTQRKTTKRESQEGEQKSTHSRGGFKRTLLKLCSRRETEDELSTDPCEGIVPSELASFPIAPLVLMCVAYLNTEKCLKEEGLFRIPGNQTDIQRLYAKFNSGNPVDLCEVKDPACVSGLLKMYFRNRPYPLIPRGPTTIKLTAASSEKNYAGVKSCLEELPEENLITLQMMVELLHQVSLFSDANHMTSANLATSCGLSVFPTMQASTAGILLKFLIDNCERLFVRDEDENGV